MSALLYGSLFLGGFVRVWGIDHRFTTMHYRDMVSAGLPVLLETARLAAIAAVPASLLGFLIAYLTTRHRFLGRGALEFSALLSYALPGTVMGVGYILAFNQGGFKLTGTSAILVAAFVFRGMPVGVRSGMAALAQVDPVLEEASALLRASVPATLRRVVLPLVLAGAPDGIHLLLRAGGDGREPGDLPRVAGPRPRDRAAALVGGVRAPRPRGGARLRPRRVPCRRGASRGTIRPARAPTGARRRPPDRR